MPEKHISDGWVIGATLGAYLILTFVVYFWGSAFIHYWCGNSPFPHSTSDGRFPDNLVLLIPGVTVVAADWAQINLPQIPARLFGQRSVRAALWMNLIGVLGFLVAVASRYGPDNDDVFFAVVSLAGLAFWPVGLLLSFGNLIWGCIRWFKTPPSASSVR
jgi:hypothetical protein